MKLSYTVTKTLDTELTAADMMVLDLYLGFDLYYVVVRTNDRHSAATGQLVSAIKWYRTMYSVGLKEAKDIVIAYRDWKEAQIQSVRAMTVQAEDKPKSESLGSLLRMKMDKNQTKQTTDLSGFAQCVFRIIGRGSYHSCSAVVANKVADLYYRGDSSEFVADYLEKSYNI